MGTAIPLADPSAGLACAGGLYATKPGIWEQSLADLDVAASSTPATAALRRYGGMTVPALFATAMSSTRRQTPSCRRWSPLACAACSTGGRCRSRRRGFSKTKLAETLAQAGIVYEHQRALGNPKPLRDLYRSGRGAEGESGYRAGLCQGCSRAVNELAESLAAATTCLLCFEADHRDCHRQVIVDDLLARDVAFGVHHL